MQNSRVHVTNELDLIQFVKTWQLIKSNKIVDKIRTLSIKDRQNLFYLLLRNEDEKTLPCFSFCLISLRMLYGQDHLPLIQIFIIEAHHDFFIYLDSMIIGLFFKWNRVFLYAHQTLNQSAYKTRLQSKREQTVLTSCADNLGNSVI